VMVFKTSNVLKQRINAALVASGTKPAGQ